QGYITKFYCISLCREQLELKKKLITEDDINWKNNTDFGGLRLVGGLDISFPKGDLSHACPCFVVLSYPEQEIIYQDIEFVHLTAPFVTEYLAFREVKFFVACIEKLKMKSPELLPQVIMVDGNGMLHSRGFGIACHLGVLTNIPTIGVAKNLFHHDGIEKGELHSQQVKTIRNLKNKGDRFPLIGNSGITWGMALRSSKPTFASQDCKPIYVSVGHRVGLETAVNLVDSCCTNRIPEPTRQADILSREYLRNYYEKELVKCPCNEEGSVPSCPAPPSSS
ncbi:hypothetical protein QZH41_011614, partial [Actinostola sp. cb2023]